MTAPTKNIKSNNGLEHIESGIYFSSLTGGIYETTKKEVEPDSLSTFGFSMSSKPWARWGHDDNYPQRLIDAVKSDPIASLLEKKIAFHWGRGIMFYKKDVDEKGNEKITVVPDKDVPVEIKDFLRVNKWNKFMLGIISDCEWWHSFCVQYITNPDGKIIQVKWQRRKNVRAELRDVNSGDIKNYYLSGYFGTSADITTNVVKVPAFDTEGNESGIYAHDIVSIDKDYNPDPAWHGISRWLHIASKIPRWILANIDNSMNIKYHIKIPLEYFLKRNPIEATKTDAERKDAIEKDQEEIYKKMDQYLAGEKNVHKAFYSLVSSLEDGKPAPGWEILTIENKIEHEAWLRAYGTAAMAMISGIGLSPSIAGTILPNGLGSGSGSDLREQFNFYIQVMTSIPRMNTLEPFEFIKQRNGWPEDLYMGYKDVILQSTDQNKSGFAQTKEQSPTSDKEANDPMKV
jgi:hypothetical protein